MMYLKVNKNKLIGKYINLSNRININFYNIPKIDGFIIKIDDKNNLVYLSNQIILKIISSFNIKEVINTKFNQIPIGFQSFKETICSK